MELGAAHLQSPVKMGSSFVSVNAGLLQGKCYLCSLFSLTHVVLYSLKKRSWGFRRGQLWGEELGGP